VLDRSPPTVPSQVARSRNAIHICGYSVPIDVAALAKARAIESAEPLHRFLSCKSNRERAEPNRWPRSAGEVGSANSDKELAMPVVLVHQGPTVTAENYRATVRKLAGKDKLESVSDWPVEGLLSHSAGESPSGFRVVDVWESQDACDAFGQHLRPILEEVGITDPPEMYPAETFVSS
jgi:hypothetical protein